jgi:hypothetical protein
MLPGASETAVTVDSYKSLPYMASLGAMVRCISGSSLFLGSVAGR